MAVLLLLLLGIYLTYSLLVFLGRGPAFGSINQRLGPVLGFREEGHGRRGEGAHPPDAQGGSRCGLPYTLRGVKDVYALPRANPSTEFERSMTPQGENSVGCPKRVNRRHLGTLLPIVEKRAVNETCRLVLALSLVVGVPCIRAFFFHVRSRECGNLVPVYRVPPSEGEFMLLPPGDCAALPPRPSYSMAFIVGVGLPKQLSLKVEPKDTTPPP